MAGRVDGDGVREGSDGTGWRPRSIDELTPEEREVYERELDSGVTELPPNHIKGWLGEKGPDLRRPDDLTPDLNAGLSQEDDAPVRALVLVLAYLVFFPLAFVLLWRSRYSRRYKLIITAIMLAGILAAGALLVRR
jgi:hypothetical protein